MQLQQGDVLLRRVSSIPKGAVERKRKDGAIVLAEGEVTGHAHRILDVDAMFYEKHGKLYLRANKPVTVTHEEHGPIVVEPGIWEVGRVREYDYLVEMARPVAD